MAALALLLAPRSWFVQNTVLSQRDKRKEVVLTGLVEFQKAQCYFAVAVQTAALVYTHQFQSSGGQFLTGVGTKQTDLIDGQFLFTIATNEYIPVVFSLVCILWHGHLTWYIIGLSLSSIALSTSTLVYFYVSRTINVVEPFVRSKIESYWLANFYKKCAGYTTEQLQIWCGPGTSFQKFSSLGPNVVLSGWNWVLWVNCCVWTILCDQANSKTINQKGSSGYFGASPFGGINPNDALTLQRGPVLLGYGSRYSSQPGPSRSGTNSTSTASI